MFKKILVLGISEARLDPEHWKKIDAFSEGRVSIKKIDPTITAEMKDTECLLVNPFTIEVTKEIIDAAPSLKYIGVLATAYANVDCAYAASRGIVVTNIPGYSTEAVAEFVFAAILENIRELERGKNRAREGKYSEEGFTDSEIKNKTFGILGLGNIGGRVAEIALAFGANVLYWSRNRKKEFEAKGVKYGTLDDLIQKCDFLSLNLALTKGTMHFLNKERIQKLKKGAIVINTSPMEIVDIVSLEKRLKSGDMTFILDHSDEMKGKDLERLSKYGNCVIYPPIANVTKEARTEKQKIFVENIESYLKGMPKNKVN